MAAPITVSTEEREKIIKMIQDDHMHARRERGPHIKQMATWERLYDETIRRRDKPWKNASNIFLGIVGDLVDEYTARSVTSLFNDRQWAPAVPLEGTDDPNWHKIQSFMQYALQSEMKTYGDFAAIIHQTAKYGTCFVFTFWDRRLRTTRDVLFQPSTISIDGQPTNVRPRDKVVLETAFGEKFIRARKKGSSHYDVQLQEGQRIVLAKVWIDRNPQDRAGEIEVEVEREEVLYDAPRLQILNNEDVYTTDTGDIQTAPFVIIERRVTLDWMRRQRQQGHYNVVVADEWQKIEQDMWPVIDRKLAKPAVYGDEQVKKEKDRALGVDTHTQVDRTRRNWLCFYHWDINGDGFDEDVIFEYDPAAKALLQIQYLSRVYQHGRRPITVFKYQSLPNRLYGKGIPERLWNIQIAINSLVNQSIDNQSLRNKPFGFYNKAAALGTRERQVIGPGVLTGVVGDPRAQVYFPELGAVPDHLMDIVQGLMLWGDRRMGKNPLPGAGGGKQTANANNTNLREGLIRIEHQIRLLAKGPQGSSCGFNELFHQIWDLYAYYMPKEKKFRIIDDNTPAELSREDLRIRPDFLFDVNLFNANSAIRREDAMLLFSQLGAQYIQLGDLNTYAELAKYLLRAFGVTQDVDKLTPNIPGILGRPTMSPPSEHKVMLTDGELDPLPTDDHVMHMQEHGAFLADPLVNTSVAPEVLERVQKHIVRHQEFIQQAQSAAAQQQGGRADANSPPGMVRPPQMGVQ